MCRWSSRIGVVLVAIFRIVVFGWGALCSNDGLVIELVRGRQVRCFCFCFVTTTNSILSI